MQIGQAALDREVASQARQPLKRIVDAQDQRAAKSRRNQVIRKLKMINVRFPTVGDGLRRVEIR